MKKSAKTRAAKEHKPPATQPVPEPQKPLTVVGFGASAGGLEAFTEVLRNLPPDTGMALVFIQHLDPKHGSILTDLLARSTHMPVHQVEDGMVLKANEVYVIPPNANLVANDGLLRLESRPAGLHMPIDGFFRSLAETHGSKAIGVVLSGSATDGTLGVTAIKAAGGITFAQDPASAKYDGMPRSAINSGCVDFILPPESIARELVGLREHPYLRHPAPADDAVPMDDEQAMKEIFAQLRSVTGVDFSLYKPGTIRRRVLRRMALQKINALDQYAAYVNRNRSELSALFQDMLINVTSFFREPVTFEALQTRVFPAIFDNRPAEQPVRVWVPGCATGEEAYSTAIALVEYMREIGKESPLQVFGTDLSDSALDRARAGIYPEDISADVSGERLRRFFTRVNSSYQIARSVRDCCIFARQNVTKDPPFSKLDLILCRNVLIYLGPSLQTAAMRLFHYALQPHGYLVLGLSESAGGSSELFELVDKKARIYARRPAVPAMSAEVAAYPERESEHPRPAMYATGLNVHRKVDQILLARYSPPTVVVDKNLRILEFRGRTASFLEHSSGEASLNLLKMSPTSLGMEAQKLVRKVGASGAMVKGKPLLISVKGGLHTVVLSVSGIQVEGIEPQYLVIMEEIPSGKSRKAAAVPALSPKTSVLAERVRELEQELIATKESLQSVIEEQEAGSEELKSANEEVQSSNEELQSTNEELLTAKEELQSANEELTTVNEEMHSRNAELQQINNDLLNLLNSVNVPTVMLDNDLKIRRFTAQAEKLFSLLSTDAGRPITDLRLNLNVPDVVALCHEVLDHLTPKEREVQDTEGNIYSMWVRPYRTTENRIEGVVLSLFDITGRRQSAEIRYRRLFEAATDGVVIADVATGEILDVNPFMTRLSGYPRSRLVGEKFWETPLFRGTPIDEEFVALGNEVESARQTASILAADGHRAEVEVVCSVYAEGERRVAQFNIRDVSARKRNEEESRRSEEGLRQAQKMEAVGRLAGGVAHDFNNLLTAILGYCELLDQELPPNHPGRNMIANIRTAGERAALLTKQLLAFGRKELVRPGPLSVNDTVTGVRQLIQVMLNKDIELSLQLQAGRGLVRADRNQIEQVILNLVLNARDAMPKGGRVAVQTGELSVRDGVDGQNPPLPPGDYVTISVQDTGSGMDEETQARVFEPFFTTKGKGEGVGLGLATVYNIVKHAGGFINVSSALGLGTTFSIYLPRLNESEVAAQAAPEPAEVRGGKETILLVDDEPAIRALASRSLEQLGYKVLQAPNGPEAMRVSREYREPIHLLLADVVMPNMSGREVAFQLAPERQEMRVLYMSGHTEDRIVHHGVLQDRMALLQKPFSLAALGAKVREVLDRKEETAKA